MDATLSHKVMLLVLYELGVINEGDSIAAATRALWVVDRDSAGRAFVIAGRALLKSNPLEPHEVRRVIRVALTTEQFQVREWPQ